MTRGRVPIQLEPGVREMLPPAAEAVPDGPNPLSLLRRTVRRAISHTLREEGLRGSEVSVLLLSDDSMRELNAKWRSQRRVTDVLSFPQYEAPELERIKALPPGDRPSPLLLGDIVVAPLTVARRAGSPLGFWLDLVRVVVHGALHLTGWDHVTPTDRRAMRQREALLAGQVLEQLGFGGRDDI